MKCSPGTTRKTHPKDKPAQVDELKERIVSLEKALEESEGRFRLLFEGSVDPILLMDGYVYVDCNEAALKILHCPRKDIIIGLRPSRISPERQPDGVLSSVKEKRVIHILKEGGTNYFEWVHRTFDGEELWVEASLTAIVIGGKKLAYVAWRDITERRRAEAELLRHKEHLEELVEERTAELEKANSMLQEKVLELKAINQELETLNYSISHDLRTPLVALSGFARILGEKHARSLDARGQRYIDMINSNARRMTELISDVLDFFSLKRKAVKQTPTDMEKLVKDVAADCRAIFPDRLLNLRMDSLPVAVGDSKMLRQVVVNLIDNAIKYAKPEGPVVIEVGASIEDDMTVYYFRDYGIGFPEAEAARIFEVFERLQGSDAVKGTGIGLAIVKRVIEKHGGKTWAEGRPDEGATFCFSLPRGRVY